MVSYSTENVNKSFRWHWSCLLLRLLISDFSSDNCVHFTENSCTIMRTQWVFERGRHPKFRCGPLNLSMTSFSELTPAFADRRAFIKAWRQQRGVRASHELNWTASIARWFIMCVVTHILTHLFRSAYCLRDTWNFVSTKKCMGMRLNN